MAGRYRGGRSVHQGPPGAGVPHTPHHTPALWDHLWGSAGSIVDLL